MTTPDEFRAERLARLMKLSKAYQDAVDRFTRTADIKEMQSVASEMKTLSEETAALIQELVKPAKPTQPQK